MKRLCSIILALLAFSTTFAQGTQSQGAPTQLNSWKGAIKGDSAFYLPNNYTQYRYFDSCGRMWFNKRGDSAIYFNDCNKQVKVLSMKDTAMIRTMIGNITAQVDSSVFATRSWSLGQFPLKTSLSTSAYTGDYNDLVNKLTGGSGINISGSNVINNTGVLSLNGISGALIRTTLSAYGITDATPNNRTITINGTSQDLTANRTWSVGTVTSVSATGSNGVSVSGVPITSSGSISISIDTTSNVGLTNKNRVNQLIASFGESVIKYSDSNATFPTKAFVGLNYLRIGGNAVSSSLLAGTNTDNNFELIRNSIAQLRFLSGGINIPVNVGIGTGAGPNASLVIAGTGTSSAQSILQVQNTTTGSSLPLFHAHAPNLTAGGQDFIGIGVSAASNNRGCIGFTFQGTGLSTNSLDLFIQGMTASRASLYPSGELVLGNGTASGTNKLTVNGTIGMSNQAYVSGGNALIVRNTTSGRLETITNSIPAYYQTTTASGNTSFSLPANAIIEYITITPTNNETIRIGTTSGGTQVSGDVAYSAGTINTITVGKKYSKTVAQTLFIQGASGSVSYEFYYK